MRFRSLCKQLALSLACAAMAVISGGWSDAPARPRDPWVFRCVLDQEARMVVIALHDQLWLAYNTTDCTLAKAWDGDVKFDGAVYTTVHGPQPTSQGTTLVHGVTERAWSLRINRREVTPTAIWKGYRLEDDGSVSLMYQLKPPDGDPIDVVESPEYVAREGGGFMLERRFTVSHAAPGVLVSIGISKNTPEGRASEIETTGQIDHQTGELDRKGIVPISLDSSGFTIIRYVFAAEATPSDAAKKGNSK